MKIGRVGPVQNQETTQARVNQLRPGIVPQLGRGEGLAALASGLDSVGNTVGGIIQKRAEEEEQSLRYNSMERYEAFQGERRRAFEELKEQLPPDGAGFPEIVDQQFLEAEQEFLESLPEHHREYYAPRLEGVRQQALTQATNYRQKAMRDYSIFSLDERLESAKLEVYSKPGSRENWIKTLKEFVSTAPGLTTLEKEKIFSKYSEELSTAAVTGAVRNNYSGKFLVPGDASKVMNALIQVESSGNPNAISPAGAVGLAQVMPPTGAEIAREIGDANFPHDGSDAEIRKYLSDPDVSVRYGTYYLNKMLSRYKGDLEVALIAYNGGPRRANNFLRAGRDYSVLPKETQEYPGKVFDQLGMSPRIDLYSPSLDLSLDDRVRLDNELDRAINQEKRLVEQEAAERRQAAEAERRSKLENLKQELAAGNLREEDIERAVEEGIITTDAELKAIRGVNTETRKAQREYQKAVDAFNSPGQSITTKQANMLAGPNLRSRLAQGDVEAIPELFMITRRVGKIPSETRDLLNGQLNSSDPARVSFAAQTLVALEEENVSFVSGFNQKQLVKARTYEHLRSAGFPADKLAEVMEVGNSSGGLAEVQKKKANSADYKKNYFVEVGDILDDFPVGFFGSTPEAPNLAAGNQLVNQYQALFDAFSLEGLEPSDAKKQSIEMLSKRWGVSSVGSSEKLMFLPPELAYRQVWEVANEAGDKAVVAELSGEDITSMMDQQIREEFQLKDGGAVRHRATPGYGKNFSQQQRRGVYCLPCGR